MPYRLKLKDSRTQLEGFSVEFRSYSALTISTHFPTGHVRIMLSMEQAEILAKFLNKRIDSEQRCEIRRKLKSDKIVLN